MTTKSTIARCMAVALVWASYSSLLAQSASKEEFTRNLAQARSGVAQAEVAVGRDYVTGRWTQRDYTSAKMWFDKASAQHSREADAWLGYLYMHGHGVPKNLVKGVAMEQGAADANDPMGLIFLAEAHEKGLGTDKNLVKARSLYQMAVSLQSPRAMDHLGELYLRGAGTPKSSNQAFLLFSRSAALGDEWGEIHLADMLRLGHHGKPDFAKAASLYEKAAAQDNAEAKYQLGVMHEKGQGFTADYVAAAQLYQDSAKQGYSPAQGALGRLYDIGQGVNPDLIDAYVWSQLAGQAHEADAASRAQKLKSQLSASQIADAQSRIQTYVAAYSAGYSH